MKSGLKRKRKYNNTRAEWLCILLFCAPAILHLLIFWLGVQVKTFQMAFTDVNTGIVGGVNFAWAYRELFAGAASSDISLALQNTLIFFCVGSLMIPVSMFFAYLIFRKTFAHSFMRIALYLPGAISTIMLALLYGKLMATDGPLMQAIQHLIGREEPIMLMVEHGVIYIIIFDVLVGIGANLVIWLGGMSRIPYDLIEYGKLEGVGPVREFCSVVLPLIWPTFVTMFSLQIINIFGATGSVLILTDGQHDTYTLAFWMYKMVQASLESEYNRVAALGLIFTVITIPLVVICRWVMNKFGEEVEY